MHTPRPLQVDLGQRSYPIWIGSGLVDKGITQLDLPASTRAFIVSNTSVAPLYLQRLAASPTLRGLRCEAIVLPDGEKYKDWQQLNLIHTRLLEHKADRMSLLVALGGGVIGDLTGFAAATYMRGISFIQVPTSLLAQVDSSVGGKTGINHPLGKNMIGAFHQPIAVIADTDTLSTLPAREFSAGMAEVIKYGLIDDPALFDWLEANMDAILAKETVILTEMIRRCCENKARIVAADERETGMRALLNLGHTFGHAIEAGMGYGNWLHGEAVGAGMVMAARVSTLQGWMSASALARIVHLIARAGLPVAAPDLGLERYLEWMQVDKKNQAGKIRFVLMHDIGKSFICDDIDPDVLSAVLRTPADVA